MLTIEVPEISAGDQAVATALCEVRTVRQAEQTSAALESLRRASMAAFGFSIPASWTGRIDVAGTTARGQPVDILGLLEGDRVTTISLHAQAANGFVRLLKLPAGAAGNAALREAIALEDRLSVVHAHAIENLRWRAEAFASIAVKRIQGNPDCSVEQVAAAEGLRREADLRATAADQAAQIQWEQELGLRGEQISSRADAEARWSNGERIFAAHEQADEPHEVRTLHELNAYAPDQLMALPALTQETKMQAHGQFPPPRDSSDSITVGDGKYTVQLGVKAGKFSFTAQRNGNAWRDMSGDGDGLMLAMFHHMLEQQQRIAELEDRRDASLSTTLRRWDVEDGTTPAIHAEPTYVMNVDPARRLVEIVPAGLTAEQLEGMPQIAVGFEINKGVPRVLVYADSVSGEVRAQFYGMPGGQLASREPEVDAHAIGELLQARAQQPAEHGEAPGAGA